MSKIRVLGEGLADEGAFQAAVVGAYAVARMNGERPLELETDSQGLLFVTEAEYEWPSGEYFGLAVVEV